MKLIKDNLTIGAALDIVLGSVRSDESGHFYEDVITEFEGNGKFNSLVMTNPDLYKAKRYIYMKVARSDENKNHYLILVAIDKDGDVKEVRFDSNEMMRVDWSVYDCFKE